MTIEVAVARLGDDPFRGGGPILGEAEEREAARVAPRFRGEWLLARSLVKATLSRRLKLDPEAITIGKSPSGVPFLRAPTEPALSVSLSRISGAVAVAIAP